MTSKLVADTTGEGHALQPGGVLGVGGGGRGGYEKEKRPDVVLGEGEPDCLHAERHTQPLGPKHQEFEWEQNTLGKSLFFLRW